MSASKSQKQFILLSLFAALLIGGFALFQYSCRESVAYSTQAASKEVSSSIAPAQLVTSQSAQSAHPADCADCAHYVTEQDKQTAVVQNVLSTQPNLDFIFKGSAAVVDVIVPRSTFDLKGSKKGQHVRLNVGDLQLSGMVTSVLEDPIASAYAVKLDSGLGRLIVDVNGHGAFSGQVVFFDDSRVLTINDYWGKDHLVKDPLSPSAIPMVILKEARISELYCAPKDATYTDKGLQPVLGAGNLDPIAKSYPPLEGVAEAITLDSLPGAEFVIYLDFDGEEVTDPRWNGGDLISAAPHPKANDDSFVTSVWQRAVEDFAPFDIAVTTDVTVYNIAAVDKRLHVVITPTDDAAPGVGGVAGLFSFRSNSPVVWVFNLSEYTCATTISHEVGHAFGLFHDGQTPNLTYYGGHNDGYTPGWAPIMGAAFSDGLNDEVDQWSKGEYTGADNQEDDLVIISGNRNGFGYKADDYSDVIGGAGVGLLDNIGVDLLGGSGLISRSNDVDVFRFASTDGDISLTVSPLDVDSMESQPGSNTQGANLAVQITLLDSTGLLVATGVEDGAVSLGSKVEATVTAGIYYITVEGAGRGADPAVGFSDYASLGEYEIVAILPTPPMAVTGGEGDYKQSNSVLLGDVETQEKNGTDFGFSYVANGPIEHTFHLTNTNLSEITNVSVSLASGDDFFVSNQPQRSIDGESTDYTLRISYDPNDRTGVHSDTVIITYDAAEPEVFEFAISGTSTKSSTEDNYETNNSTMQAHHNADLNAVENVWLSDYKGQAFFRSYKADFFTFNVDNEELVTVEVAYDDTDGPIAFELRNGYNTVLGRTTAEDGILQFIVPDNYNSQHKTFYIYASNTADSSVYNAYDLRWFSQPLIVGEDDSYEENDSLEEAFDLTGAFSPRLSEYLGEGISKDEDWYKIEISEDPFNRFLYVAAEFTHADGDINIEVFDENGLNIFTFFGNTVSATLNDYEVISVSGQIDLNDSTENFSPSYPFVMGVSPGTYYIRVDGDFAGNSYDLVVKAMNDDTYEVVDSEGTQNNTIENAFDLGDSIVDHWLSEVDGIGVIGSYGDNATAENFTYGMDVDWYTFTINPNAPVEQMVLETTNSSQGFAIFTLYNSEGVALASNLLGLDFLFSTAVYFDQPEGSTFFVQVVPLDEVWSLNGYDFRITLLTDPVVEEGVEEDRYEDNDNFKDLYDLTNHAGFWLASVDGLGTQLDPDWFEISIPQGAGQLIAYLTSDSSSGNVDLTLSRKDGPKIFESMDGGDTETIIWDDPIPGAYALTVTGDRVGNQYNLFWEVVLEDDNYEENDGFAEAYDLSVWERSWLRKLDGPGVQRDEDWYKITVPAGTAELDIRTNFNPLAGDIDLELYNSSGYLIARSISQTDVESLTYSTPASGDYFIQIHYGNAGNEYDLWWAAFTQAELDAVVEDAYEPNDTIDSGYVLVNDQVWLTDLLGLATQTNDDWFEIAVADGNVGLDVDVTFTHADGDIDVEVYDALGSIITRSESLTNDETVNYNAPLPAGTYFIRVFGANNGNEYDMYWVDRSEDDFEMNNTRESAYDLSDGKGFYISQIGEQTQGDDDWYEVTAYGASTFIVAQIDFVHANGNIDLALYNSSGALLDDSVSSTDKEYLQVPVEAGTYYIRVFGDDLYNDYDLIWNSAEDDGHEDNDVFVDASDLSSNAGVELAGIQADDDWYWVVSQPGEVRLEIDVTFTDSAGDINFEIYDASNALLVTSDGDDDHESITYGTDPLGAIYYIRVYGDDLGNAYDLVWETLAQDAYEENDNIDEAYDLTSLESTYLSDFEGHGSLLDEDWYILEHVDTLLFVEAYFTHADGNIDLELFTNVDGQLIRVEGATSVTDNETMIHAGAAGTYYLKVFGGLNGNTYDLIWNSATDDPYEPNTDSGSAGSLDAIELEVIPDLVQFNEDWYSLTVAPGDDILLIECLFANSEGNVDLELWDSTVTTSIAIANSETDNEYITETNLPAGLYYLHVYGAFTGTNYTLRWNSAADDVNEPNNDPDTATSIVGSEGLAVPGVAFDEDWFQVSLPAGSNYLFVDLANLVIKGDLDLSVYDATNELLAESATTDDDEAISLNGLAGGTYYIQVTGDVFGNDYSLLWRGFQDDPYETNDEVDDAYNFSVNPGVLLSVAGSSFGVELNDDYYRVVTPKDSTHLTVNLTFLHADGDLELEVLDAAGGSISSVNSSNDNETLTVSVPPQMLTYYIRVFGPISGNTYDLIWSTDNVDNYESNDTDATAFDVSAINDSGELSTLDSSNNGHGTQEGDDWYQFTVPSGQVRFVMELSFVHEEGNIDVELFDSSLNLIATAATTDSIEVINTPIDPNETLFYIYIKGDNQTNSYDFNFSTTDLDTYELNNFIVKAFDLSASEAVWLEDVDGYATQFDDDWYLIVISDNSALLTVECEFTHATGDIDLELYQLILADSLEGDGSGIEKRRPKLVDRKQTTDDNELLVYDVTGAAGLYYVRAYQDNAGNPYRLRWDDGIVDLAGDQVYLDEEWEFSFLASDTLTTDPVDLDQNDDGDRYPKWAEFALGLDENSYDQAIVTQYIGEDGGDSYYFVEYVRTKEAVIRGYQFFVQESDTLTFNDTLAVYVGAVSISEDVEKVVYRSAHPVDEAASCFFRLDVETPVKGH